MRTDSITAASEAKGDADRRTGMLLPVDTMPVEKLVVMLSSGTPSEWRTYRGKRVIDLPLSWLLESDPAFMVFWATTIEEEIRAFERITQVDSLSLVSLETYFGHQGRHMPEWYTTQKVSEWAQMRLKQAYTKLFYFGRGNYRTWNRVRIVPV